MQSYNLAVGKQESDINFALVDQVPASGEITVNIHDDVAANLSSFTVLYVALRFIVRNIRRRALAA